MMHGEPHPFAGQSIAIVGGIHAGEQITIEDWWDRVAGKSWMDCDCNPACLEYALSSRTPIDDEVAYGRIGPFGKLIHVTRLSVS